MEILKEYETLWEIIKYELSLLPFVKQILDLFTLENLAKALTGGVILTGLIIILKNIERIKKYIKKKRNKAQGSQSTD